jgi:hypothetical protein
MENLKKNTKKILKRWLLPCTFMHINDDTYLLQGVKRVYSVIITQNKANKTHTKKK